MSIKTKKYWKQQKEYYSDSYKEKPSNVHDMEMFLNSVVPERQINGETRHET